MSRDTKKGREARHGKKRRREGTRKNAAIRKRIGYEQASSGIGLDAKGFREFDPGSGRTLAACLTHASRTGLVIQNFSEGRRTRLVADG